MRAWAARGPPITYYGFLVTQRKKVFCFQNKLTGSYIRMHTYTVS
jgi:hypothetical protein